MGPMLFDDLRATIQAALGNLTPSKAQQLAKDLMEPGAAKDQIAKTAAELLDWSQQNRERMSTFVRREIEQQMKAVGVATQSDLDRLRKRVRDLERATGATASGKKKTTTRSRRSTSSSGAASKGSTNTTG
jgi:polyhydroxyalkanoate synthesis regulator phasin